jgi:hypothetical protein
MKISSAFTSFIAAAMLSAASSFAAADLQASELFQKLDGTWRGSGKVTLSSGNEQRISCKAYYNVKGNGSDLGFAIRCAAPSNKFELRGNVRNDSGALSGTWEERTFNAVGDVSGTAKSDRVNLAIGGTVSGSMQISLSGSRQQVAISTKTEGLKTISINLRR